MTDILSHDANIGKILCDAAMNADIDSVRNILNPLLIKKRSSKDISRAIRILISYGLLPCDEPKLTVDDRVSIIKQIMLTPNIVELIEIEEINDIFDSATTFGPSTILKILLDNQNFLKKIDKSKILWALEHHYVIDILSSKTSTWNLIEKSSSHVLKTLFSYQYILDLIDSRSALSILQSAMIRPNADSIAVIFENHTILDKICDDNIKQQVRHLGLIDDANIVQQLLKNENFTKFLSQEDWNICYRCAKSDEVKQLLEPYYYEMYWCNIL